MLIDSCHLASPSEVAHCTVGPASLDEQLVHVSAGVELAVAVAYAAAIEDCSQLNLNMSVFGPEAKQDK